MGAIFGGIAFLTISDSKYLKSRANFKFIRLATTAAIFSTLTYHGYKKLQYIQKNGLRVISM
jgi:hypothetical protein